MSNRRCQWLKQVANGINSFTTHPLASSKPPPRSRRLLLLVGVVVGVFWGAGVTVAMAVAADPVSSPPETEFFTIVQDGLVGAIQPLPGLAPPGLPNRSDLTRPLAPTNAWVALENGERHWYAFRDEGDGAAITVRMTVLPPNGANFWVLTPLQATQWLHSAEFAAVGAGAQHPFFHNDFYWTGSFIQSGLYYVLVESSQRGLSNYRLTISGNTVSFPTAHSHPAPGADLSSGDINTSAEPPPTATPKAPDTASPPASSAEKPLPPVGQSWAITGGGTHWYAFRDEGDESSIQVRADASPDDCITFQVWTPEQLRLWQLGEPFRPIGAGTANATLKADLFWTGSFVKSGVYYVVVRPTPPVSQVCTYQLWATGDDVTLVLPAQNR